MAEQGPLRCAEERVGFDVRGAGSGAETTHFVFDEEFADEGFAEAVDGGQNLLRLQGELEVSGGGIGRSLRGNLRGTSMFWKGNVIAEDVGKSCVSVLAFEGGGAEEHFVD